MELKMKHLVVSLVVLCVLIVPEARAQRSSSPRIQELVDASEPLGYDPSVAPVPPVVPADPAGPVAPAYAPGAVPADPSQGPSAAPMASSFGGAEQQWGVYEPPDYEDGLTSVGPCCETCGGGVNCPDIWTVRNRVRVWSRSKPRLITTTAVGDWITVWNPNTSAYTQEFQATTAIGTRSATFDIAPGYGASVRRYWRRAKENSDLYLEGVYFGLNHWRERRGYNATGQLFSNYFDNVGNIYVASYGNLFTPFADADDPNPPVTGIAGFDRAEDHEFTYESKINNVEINLRMARRARADRIVLHPNGRWRRQCQPGIYGTSIFGIRYFSLNERFTFLGSGRTSVDVYDNAPPNNFLYSFDVNTTGTYDIYTSNDMLGLQFGMELLYRHCLWGWGAEAKVCPSINFSRQRSRVFSTATAPGDPFSGPIDEFRSGLSDDLALVGDVSVLAYYKVRPNLTLRASWDMMWLVGVAMAPEQLQWVREPAPRVNNHGTLFYQGVSLGVEWTR